MAEVIKKDDPRLGVYQFPAKVKPKLRSYLEQVQNAERALETARQNANHYAVGVLDILDVPHDILTVNMDLIQGTYTVNLPPGWVPEEGASDDAHASPTDGDSAAGRPDASPPAPTDAAAVPAATGQEKETGQEAGEGRSQGRPQEEGQGEAQGAESPGVGATVDAGGQAGRHLSLVP